MQDLTELTEGDEVHVTIEGNKTLPLTVRGVEKRKAWLGYDGQEYATVTPSGVTNDEHNWTLQTLYCGDDNEIVGVEDIEAV